MSHTKTNARSVGEKYSSYREIIATALIVEMMKRILSGEHSFLTTYLPTSIESRDLDDYQIPLVYMGEGEYHIGDTALDLGGTQITWQAWEADLRHKCVAWAMEQKSIRALQAKGVPTNLSRICRHPVHSEKIPLEQFHYFLGRDGTPRPEFYIDGVEYWAYRRHVQDFCTTGVFDHNLEITSDDLDSRRQIFPDGLYRQIALGRVKPPESFRTSSISKLNISHLDI